jgi:hypothetical protein
MVPEVTCVDIFASGTPAWSALVLCNALLSCATLSQPQPPAKHTYRAAAYVERIQQTVCRGYASDDVDYRRANIPDAFRSLKLLSRRCAGRTMGTQDGNRREHMILRYAWLTQ